MPFLGIIEDIRINSIHHSAYNPRKGSGKLNELLISINNTGLLQPLVVRPIKEGFEIVAGNRRLEACRRLGWRKIPTHIVELSDREAFEVSLIENIQRRSLHPIEEAYSFRKYVTDYGWGGVSELARRIGKSQEYVSKRMGLLTLPKKIRNELINGRIHPSVAEELLTLDDEDMQLELGCLTSSNRLTLKEVRSLAKVLKSDRSICVSTYPASYNLSNDGKRSRYVDRSVRRMIVVLRTALLRIDEIIDDLEDNWFLQELLLEYRLNLHNQISQFIKMRKKVEKVLNLQEIKVLEKVS